VPKVKKQVHNCILFLFSPIAKSNLMDPKNKIYRALLSSDWNECLAPCGPFDFISFIYPESEPHLKTIFKRYTGNIISLGDAVRQIRKLLPAPITKKQMDAYLNTSFITYRGIPELIEWCLNNDILFMVNTTGMIGYFQRIFARGLLPHIPVLSAHPMVRYARHNSDPEYIFDLYEIKDKFKNSEAVVRSFNIPSGKIILIGDSGGDGPHFECGAGISALLIGSMTKASLRKYCDHLNIPIQIQFGISYADGDDRDPEKEMQFNFTDLLPLIEDFLV
jgi:2-hydroxy-3-keto-5-methylthiopentenyl-1-phosphate phosphatase